MKLDRGWKRGPQAALVVAGLLVAVPALAQQIAPPKLPYEKYTLPNGLQVVLHEDHSAPLVAVNLWYHVGSKDEKAGKTGFAHLFEHMMFQGSEHHDTDYFKALEPLGAEAHRQQRQEGNANHRGQNAGKTRSRQLSTPSMRNISSLWHSCQQDNRSACPAHCG